MNTYYNPIYPYNCNPYASQMLVPQMQQQLGLPQPQQVQQQQQQTLQTNGLNGKIVDSEDIVRATEVPMGGYGIFPKADLSEIYIKSWNNNGTTSIITFKPVITTQENNIDNTNTQILEKLSILENKIDSIKTTPMQLPQKKEVNLSDY